jgi:hypothetical protein
MKTSNFANNRLHQLEGISISRYPATRQGFKGLEFAPLMPSANLLACGPDDWQYYEQNYNRQLSCLNPKATWDEWHNIASYLSEEGEPVLLCYESAKTLDTHPCHRRLVAAWFERELGVEVPEWRVAQ